MFLTIHKLENLKKRREFVTKETDAMSQFYRRVLAYLFAVWFTVYYFKGEQIFGVGTA